MNEGIIQLLYKNRRLRLLAIIVFTLLIIYFLYSFLTNSYITVSTNNPSNVISLIKLGKNGSKKTLTYSQGKKLTATVPGGQYEITVNNKQSGITQDISLAAMQSKTYQLNIPKPVEPVSVLPYAASSLVANNSQMYYLDNQSNNIYQLNANGVALPISPIVFKSVQWANAAFGVGQDYSGKLYTLSNGSVSPMTTPFLNGRGSTQYSVGTDGMVYVSSGGTIYASQNASGFHKLYSVSSNNVSLFAGSGKLAIVTPLKGKSYAGRVDIINAQGNKLASSNLYATSVIWSPGGSKLIISGSTTAIYNSSLNKIAALPTSSGVIAWINNSKLIYGSKQSLWEYDADHNQSFLLASTPGGEVVSGIFLSADGSFAYFSAENLATNSNILLRVGLTPQANNVPPYYSGLSVILPDVNDQCTFSYSDFVKPYIVITGWTDQNYCSSSAQALLREDGLPVGGFGITFSQ